MKALRHMFLSDKFKHYGRPYDCEECPFAGEGGHAGFWCNMIGHMKTSTAVPECDAGQWREAAGEEFEGMVQQLDAADKIIDAHHLYESLRAEASEAPRGGGAGPGPRAPAGAADASRKAVEASPPPSAGGAAGRRLWALSYENRDGDKVVHQYLYDDNQKEAVDELFNTIWSNSTWSWWLVEVR